MDELDLREKARLTGGEDLWHTPAIERLGIPGVRVTDGPSGARGTRYTGSPSACMPCSTAIAATWDRDLVRRVGAALAGEARRKGAHVLLAPTVNIHRHPVTGRHFECFSEDPYLTAELAVAYIDGVQGGGVGCAVKHFVANDQEHERHTISAEVDERTLREIYLPPFEAAVRRAGAWMVMAAYNRLAGVYCSEHAPLLNGLLRDEWGFDGVVLSDWFGTHSSAAVAAGLDLEMPGPPQHLGEHLLQAAERGEIDTKDIERAAARLLALVDRARAASVHAQHDDAETVASDAAERAVVLLTNDGVLPFDDQRITSIAVVGPNAARPHIQGGGSARVDPPYEVSPLDGLAKRADVRHEPGVVSLPRGPLGRAELRVPDSEERGVLVEYFDGPTPDGDAVHREVIPRTTFTAIGPAAPGVSQRYSLRATADLEPDRSGTWRFWLASAGASSLRIDGDLVIDNTRPERGASFYGAGSTDVEGAADLVAGRRYRLTAELSSPGRGAVTISGFQLDSRRPDDADALDRAVAAATDADVVVAVVGHEHVDSEGGDRTGIDLPDDQVELIRAVTRANPRTVVLVNTGAPVTMDWADDVAAVAQIWYPGQEAGAAVAAVLFGDRDAGGRLPTTFPRRLEDSPAFAFYPGENGTVVYGEGLFVGYRHYDTRDVEPLFCFGHGLSYTRFDYGPPTVEPDGSRAEVEVTNVGDRPGREVVQLYVRPVGPPVERPEKELKEFAAVELEPGERRVVRFELPPRAFARWDPDRHDWVVDPGDYELLVGSSSRDIRRRALVTRN